MNRYALLGAMLVLATAPLDAQNRRGRDEDREYTSRIDTTLALSANGVVELSLQSGDQSPSTRRARLHWVHAEIGSPLFREQLDR